MTANLNKDLHIPEWVNESYFADILKAAEPDHVRIMQFTCNAAIPPGENFTSVMIRVSMILEMNDRNTKAKSFILKTMLDMDKGGRLVKGLSLFPKEIKMYQKFLPEFEELYKNAGWNIQLAPKCLYTESSSERISIIFEDLRERHFKTIDRLQGCGMSEMRSLLQKMAEFHAASAVWVERNGPFPKDYEIGFLSPDMDNDLVEKQRRLYNLKSESFKKAMASWGLEEAEKYSRNFPNFEQYWNWAMRALKADPADFNVLNHGDFWTSNVMLNRRPNGNIDQVLLLDYQVCNWGSPAQDLIFFITISADKDIRVKEFDHFIEIYHQHLVDCLKILQYKKPSPKLRDLQMAMYKENSTFYAFFAIYNHLTLTLLPTDKDSNIHNALREDEFGDRFRMRSFTNPLYVETMLDVYPFFYRRGIFDFEDSN